MSTLQEIVTAPWQDEKTLERASNAVRKLRALADAIENDPDLAPSNSSLSACYSTFGSEKKFLSAVRRLLPDATPHIDPSDGYFVLVEGELGGEPIKFRVPASAVGSKRTVVRQVPVEEWTLDEDVAS